MRTEPRSTSLHPWLRIDRALRPLLAERMEHGATIELDQRIMALIIERRHVELASWWD